MNIKLILRKKLPEFNSIERVFLVLTPYLNCSITNLPYASRGLLNRIKNIFFILRYRSKLIHISGHDNYLLSFPFFKKSVLTIHDVEGIHKYEGIKALIFKKLWIDWPIKHASQITTISNFSKREIHKILGDDIPIRVIPNPLSLEIEYKSKVFHTKKPRILQIGTKQNKNLFRLIEAIKDIECQLIVIGVHEKKIELQLRNYNVDYKYRSQLSNAEMIKEYEKADLLAFVSTYEGFGLPVIEAQAMGRVVLTSNVASMPEVAGEGALFVDPFSVKSIREGIERLINDVDLRKTLIDRGRENVKRFEPKEIAKQYKAIYEEVEKLKSRRR